MADFGVQLQPQQKATPASKRKTAVGKFGGGFQGTNGGGSFTHNRWYASLFYDGPSGSWMQGIDGGLVVHYIGQYWDNSSFVPAVHGHVHFPVILPGVPTGNDHSISQTRKVREWVTLDLIVNY